MLDAVATMKEKYGQVKIEVPCNKNLESSIRACLLCDVVALNPLMQSFM